MRGNYMEEFNVDSILYENLGKVLKDKRIKNGYSLEDLSNKIDNIVSK